MGELPTAHDKVCVCCDGRAEFPRCRRVLYRTVDAVASVVKHTLQNTRCKLLDALQAENPPDLQRPVRLLDHLRGVCGRNLVLPAGKVDGAAYNFALLVTNPSAAQGDTQQKLYVSEQVK